MANGFSIDTGIPDIDRLLSRGGMDSMLLTIWLIIGAVTFGAMLEEFGLINRLIDPMIAAADDAPAGCSSPCSPAASASTSSPATSTSRWCCRAGSSGPSSRERGLAPTNLSRLAADSGTVTSPLVPWNSCGAFMGAVLGVSTLLYLPYAVFCFASPALSVLYGFTGFKIEKIDPTESVEETRMSTDARPKQAPGGAVAEDERRRR